MEPRGIVAARAQPQLQLRTAGAAEPAICEQPIYGYFAQWRDTGTWERVNDLLRRRLRVARGREPEPSAAIVDSQSAKTTEKGANAASMPSRR
jgi:transposase